MMRDPRARSLASLAIFAAAALVLASPSGACKSSPSGGGSGGSSTGGGGGEAPCVPEDQQTSCTRVVPDSVSPPIECTPKKPGSAEYDGCTPNTPCGPVHGCVLERCAAASGLVTTTHAPGAPGYVAPPTLLPPMGTEMTGRGTA